MTLPPIPDRVDVRVGDEWICAVVHDSSWRHDTHTIKVELGSPVWSKTQIQACTEGVGWRACTCPPEDE